MASAHLRIVVCSYARGRFLQNCIASIERHLPFAEVLVVDDDSPDELTRTVLTRCRERHRVIVAGAQGDAHRLGGLYANLQRALDDADDDTLFVMLQDDMQLVRDVTPRECDAWREALGDSASFLHPCFLKGDTASHGGLYRVDTARRGLYVRSTDGEGAGHHYADVHIALAGALRTAGFRYLNGEKRCEASAASLGMPRLGYLVQPFAMFLPFVPAHRHRRATRALTTASRRARLGFYPFKSLDASAVKRLASRQADELPFAEAWLETVPEAPSRPWRYGPFEGQRWLKHLHRIEVTLGRE